MTASAAAQLAPAWTPLPHNGLPDSVDVPGVLNRPLFAMFTDSVPFTFSIRFWEAETAYFEVWTNEVSELEPGRVFPRWAPSEVAVLALKAERGELDRELWMDLRDVKVFDKRRVCPQDAWDGAIPRAEWRESRDACTATLGDVLAAIDAELAGVRIGTKP